jgi:hypothetical protein
MVENGNNASVLELLKTATLKTNRISAALINMESVLTASVQAVLDHHGGKILESDQQGLRQSNTRARV